MKKIIQGLSLSFIALFIGNEARALDLDWSGQFRGEAAMFSNYTMSSDGTIGAGALNDKHGYAITTGASKKAQFQTYFARLTPKLIVNDNVSIKSEWWIGNPRTSFFGDGYPTSSATTTDRPFYNSNQNSGSTITAQRLWGEFVTDIGTLQVGRAPLHWGLGIVQNSGDGIFDRYQTTADVFRLNAKFGNFSFIPATVKYKNSTFVGGAASANQANADAGALAEFMIGLRYENPDEDFEGGVNFIRRIAGANSGVTWINGKTGGLNYTTWDLYGKKRAGKFEFGIEAPIYSGSIVGVPYKAFALATELKFKPKESWTFTGKFGKAPGQQNDPSAVNAGTNPGKFNLAYFNPNYKLGLIMFNYQLRAFAGRQETAGVTTDNTQSIYDNPITNATYLSLMGAYQADKWKFYLSFVTASADETAATGLNFFNSWERTFRANGAGKNQESGYGSEIDWGIGLNWDEYTQFGLDFGLFMPGDFYKFSNTTTDVATTSVFATMFKVGVSF